MDVGCNQVQVANKTHSECTQGCHLSVASSFVSCFATHNKGNTYSVVNEHGISELIHSDCCGCAINIGVTWKGASFSDLHLKMFYCTAENAVKPK